MAAVTWPLLSPTVISNPSTPMFLKFLGDFQFQDCLTCHNGCDDGMHHPWISSWALWERTSQLVAEYLRQNLQMRFHWFFLHSPSHSISRFSWRPVSLKATQVQHSPSSWMFESCSLLTPSLHVSFAQTSWHSYSGLVFPCVVLCHPSQIKLSPSVLFGLTSGFPSWPRLKFDLGLCSLWVPWFKHLGGSPQCRPLSIYPNLHFTRRGLVPGQSLRCAQWRNEY